MSDLGVLDTSVVIALDDIEVGQLPAEITITAVTLGELSVGPLVATTDAERMRRIGHLQWVESTFDPLPYDAYSARVFGRIHASLVRAGRTSRTRVPDLMIAAIAIANDAALYTANPKDFAGIDALELRPVIPT